MMAYSTDPRLPSWVDRRVRAGGWTGHASWRCALLPGWQLLSSIDDPGRESWRLLLLLAGSGAAGIGDAPLEPLRPGDALVRAPLQPHRLRRDHPAAWVELAVELPPPAWEAVQALGLITPADRWWRGPLGPALLAAVRGVLASTSADPTGVAALATLIAALRERAGASDDRRLAEARRLLAEPRGPAMPAVAAAVGLRGSAFRAWFRQRTGLSPMAYRLRARIAAARDLLSDPTLSVAAVAERLGYADAFAFSRQFRAEVGLSPARWRRQ